MRGPAVFAAVVAIAIACGGGTPGSAGAVKAGRQSVSRYEPDCVPATIAVCLRPPTATGSGAVSGRFALGVLGAVSGDGRGDRLVSPLGSRARARCSSASAGGCATREKTSTPSSDVKARIERRRRQRARGATQGGPFLRSTSGHSLPPSPAPIATGWSDSCRAGFAPAEGRCLSTAHRKRTGSVSASIGAQRRVALSRDVVRVRNRGAGRSRLCLGAAHFFADTMA